MEKTENELMYLLRIASQGLFKKNVFNIVIVKRYLQQLLFWFWFCKVLPKPTLCPSGSRPSELNVVHPIHLLKRTEDPKTSIILTQMLHITEFP